MSFRLQYSLFPAPEYQPLGRIYVHTTGLDEVFGGSPISAVQHVLEQHRLIRDEMEFGFDQYEFLHACVWGMKRGNKPMVDIAAWEDVGDWKTGNATIIPLYYGNGEISGENVTTCAEFIRVLAREEEWRKESDNLEHYLRITPPIQKDLLASGFQSVQYQL